MSNLMILKLKPLFITLKPKKTLKFLHPIKLFKFDLDFEYQFALY